MLVWVFQEVDAKIGLNIRDLLGKTAVRESGEGARGVREICKTRCKFNPCGGEKGKKRVDRKTSDYVVQFQEYFEKANVCNGRNIPPWTLSIPAHSWSGSLKQGLSVSCY